MNASQLTLQELLNLGRPVELDRKTADSVNVSGVHAGTRAALEKIFTHSRTQPRVLPEVTLLMQDRPVACESPLGAMEYATVMFAERANEVLASAAESYWRRHETPTT